MPDETTSSMESQIGDMLGMLGDESTDSSEGGNEDADSTSNDSEESSDASGDVDDSEGTDEGEEDDGESQGEDSDSGDEEGDEDSEEAEEEGEEDELSEVELLRNELAEMREQLEAKENPEEEENTTLEVGEIEDVDFMAETDFEDALSDPKEFNKSLNKVFKESVTRAVSQTTEQVLRAIPNVVKNSVAQQVALQKSTDKFYTDNPDLAKHKKTIATVAENVLSENPEITINELLLKVETAARKKLALKKVVQDKGSKKKPAFAKGSSKGGKVKKKAKPQLSELDQQLADMLEFA